MLKIRLQRKGRKKRPFYRIVVAEHTSPVQGRFLEIVGHYNPVTEPKEVVFDVEKIKKYIENGAQPSDTVARLGAKNGIKEFEKFISARVMKPSKADLEAAKKAEEEAIAKAEAEKAAQEAAEQNESVEAPSEDNEKPEA